MMTKLKDLISKVQHWQLSDQVDAINQILRGHYAYYGLGGNQPALHKILRVVERFWRRSLSRRCWKGKITWERFNELKKIFRLQQPKLQIPFARMQSYAVL